MYGFTEYVGGGIMNGDELYGCPVPVFELLF
jgi:hypothetical protein